MCVLGHQESDFQSSFYAVECQKDVPTSRLKIAIDKRQYQLSESIVWPLHHSQKVNVLSQKVVNGIDGIKTQ